MRSQVKLICFDLGNVLVKLSKTPYLDTNFATSGSYASLRYSKLIRSYRLGTISSTLFFAKLSQLLNFPGSLIDLKKEFVEARILGEHIGAQQLLLALKKTGIRICLLSNINEAHWEAQRDWPMFSIFDSLYLSFQKGCAKPDREIYLDLELQERCTGPEIVFFDDDLKNIETAACLGWKAFWLDEDMSSPIGKIVNILSDIGVLEKEIS